VIGDENLGDETHHTKTERVSEFRTANDKAEALTHCRKIGRNVDRVGTDEQTDQ
jgi:hypothetical protein